MFQFNSSPENYKCDNTCEDGRGGFKKSSKTLKSVSDENREPLHLQHTTEEEASRRAAASEAKDITTTFKLEPPKIWEQNIKPITSEKLNWSTLADKTGTRPTVSKYSLSRYSLDEWRRHNDAVLDFNDIVESNALEYNAQTAIGTAFCKVDKVRRQNNNMLKQRAKEVFRWKVEVETACRAMSKEVELLEMERHRIKAASRVLMLPESIIKECIELRRNRAETDLVSDLAGQELIKEMALVNKIRQNINSLLQKIEEQLATDKSVKQSIEYDWCDKTEAYKTDSNNLSLDLNSNTIMFKPGSAGYNGFTTPLEFYVFYCRQNIENVETVRQISADLRGSLNAILIKNGQKLRQQADKTDAALANTVELTTEHLTRLEEHLKTTLISLSDTEKLIQNLQNSIIKLDRAMKLAQTRLDNRNNQRPHVENVRDESHSGLIQEVKIIHENVSLLLNQLNKAEQTTQNLIKKRLEIEKDIAFKRKTLTIDRERCGMIRSHYPTASQLSGL